MNAFWLALVSNALVSDSVTVYHKHRDIATKSKIELKPMLINCGLNDMIRISAPIFTDQSRYYLTKPNGEITTLNITSPTKFKKKDEDYSFFQFTMMRSHKPFVTMQYGYDVFSLNQDDDILTVKESQMNENEFMLGPLVIEDHGNWVLSTYNMDDDGDWIEMFQVISVIITEFVPLDPISPRLRTGATLHLRLAYPLQAVSSCELQAPQSSFDRMYERSHLEMDKCAFVLRNVTTGDTGMWRILAVAKIVYEGRTMVTVMPSIG